MRLVIVGMVALIVAGCASQPQTEAERIAASQNLSNLGAVLIAAGQRRGGGFYPAPAQNYPRSTTCMGGYRTVTCSNF